MTPATAVFTRFTGSYGDQFGITAGARRQSVDNRPTSVRSVGSRRRRRRDGHVPAAARGSRPFGITSGPDGNLWFADGAFDSIGRITPSGAVTIVTAASASAAARATSPPGPTATSGSPSRASTRSAASCRRSRRPRSTSAAAHRDHDDDGDAERDRERRQRRSARRASSTARRPPTAADAVAVRRPPGPDAGQRRPDEPPAVDDLPLPRWSRATAPASRRAPTARSRPPRCRCRRRRRACSNGRDDDRDGFADARDPRCHCDGNPRVATSYRPLAASESPVDDPVLTCSSGGLALVSAELVSARTRVRLRGIAERAQGKRRRDLRRRPSRGQRADALRRIVPGDVRPRAAQP